MVVGIFGGSFNPPHVGHAMVAAWVRWTEQADAVWFVPTFEHAFGKPLEPFERRLRAAKALATTLGPWAHAVSIEAELPRPSYTITTLDALSAATPQHTLRLIVGADVFEQIPLWRDYARILADYRPIVAGRAGWAEIPGVPTFPAVSSTDIRARLSRGEPVHALMPERVRQAWASDDGPLG